MIPHLAPHQKRYFSLIYKLYHCSDVCRDRGSCSRHTYLDRKYMFMTEKKSLTEYSYSVKDGKSKSFPRCHLDSRVHSHALCKEILFSVTKSFDCVLGGPFGNLHLDPALSLPDSLCAHNYFDLRFIGLKRYSICLGVYHFKVIVSMHYFNLFREIVERFSQFSCLIFFFSSMRIRLLLLQVRKMQVLISQEHLPDRLSSLLLIHLFL